MATKKHYTIDNDTRTITGNIFKMTEKEKQDIALLREMGYTFEQKVNKRKGDSHKRSHYENNLIEIDRTIFNELIAKGGSGSYAKATSFASHIIKLGKYTDEHPEEKEALNTFRELAQKDFVEAKLFFKEIVKEKQ